MRVCFIADSSSIHTQRIVSHSVQKGDEILVLSSALYLADLPGTRTIHLLDKGDAVFTTAYEQRKPQTDLKARVKSVIPVSAKLLLIEIRRAFWLLSKRKFCAEELRRFDPDIIFAFRSFPEGVLAAYCHVRPLILRTAGPDVSKLPKYPVFKQLIRQAV